MDYPDYAAGTSPHFSSTIASPSTTTTTAENNTLSQRLQPMNTFSSSPSTSLQSPPSNDVTFQQQQQQQQQHRSSSSSLDAERHFHLLTASSSSIDTTPFHHHEPTSTAEFSRHVHLTPHPTTAMMQDYWHGQTPLLLDNPLHVHELDNIEVNHSERGIAGFVSKLYQSLQAPDNEQKYARWCKHDGKDMFIIECIPKFTEVVLPRLFKHCKFASFVRQLNIYGFQRDTDARKTKDTRDKESCRWYHPYFRPGRRDLFHLIRRKAARYPRRKRVKVEEDPETIVNVGDDSDTDMMNDKYRCRSSSVSSAAISQPQQDNNSNNTMEDMSTAAQPGSSSSVMGQQPTTTAAQPPPQQQQPSLGHGHHHHHQQHTVAPPPPPPQAQAQAPSITPHHTTNNNEVVMSGSTGIASSHLQEQSPTSTTATTGEAVTVMTATPPTCIVPTSNDMTHREREMQNQIFTITQGYQELAKQMKRAYEIIGVQGRRIQVLETELRNQQQRPSDMSYLGNSNNNNNNGEHGTSTTADASNTFTNHSSPNGNTTDMYTQLFPHPGVRIKPEMTTPYDNMLLPPSDDWVYQAGQFSSPSSATPDRPNAATMAAAAAVAAAAANNNGGAPTPDHTTTPTHGDITTFGLAAAAAAVAAAKYPPTTHHHHHHHPDQAHHPHHSHHQIQQHRPM